MKKSWVRKHCKKCKGHGFLPCPFTACLLLLLATGGLCRGLQIPCGGGDIPVAWTALQWCEWKNKNSLMEKGCNKCKGHCFLPCPLISCFVLLSATGQLCRQLLNHSGDGDIPSWADRQAMMKLKNKNTFTENCWKNVKGVVSNHSLLPSAQYCCWWHGNCVTGF